MPPNDVASVAFIQKLAEDVSLRDAFSQYLHARIAHEDRLGRVDATHSLDFQKGRVAEAQAMIDAVKSLEHPSK